MQAINRLFEEELQVINIGTPTFEKDLKRQGRSVLHLDWTPPAGGDLDMIAALDALENLEHIERANAETVERMKSAHPFLVGIERAGDVIPGMTEETILHAGPPIEWDRMCGPMRGAIIGALIYEGRAKTAEEAEALAGSGKIRFAPCHEHQTVGPMAGVVSPSMPVHIVINKTHQNTGYCTVNEGLGKVLRYGAYSEEVIERLRWIERVFAPVLKEALSLVGDEGIDLKSLIAQAVHMGDECHNRNKAATSLFFREITPYLLETTQDREVVKSVLDFIRKNDHYFLNLSMPACKVSLDAASGIDHSTIVTTMARNGVDFGIRISGLGENQWFTAPANYVKGLLFPGYSQEDAAPDIGDSTITETMGIGGFVMGGAPAIVQFVGGTVEDALAYSESMYEITESENNNYSIPTLNFRGSALGIDVTKVIQTGTLPIINTGMAHKVAGVGQVGAGLVSPPKACFEKALQALYEKECAQ